MRAIFGGRIAAIIFLISGLPVSAHHSGAAEFDVNKKVDLSGVVTKVEWTNPHAHFYMDVKDESGKVTNWNLELASPNVLIRNGWRRNSIKPGDTVSVSGIRAKDNSTYASASVITFPDGHKLNFLYADEPGK